MITTVSSITAMAAHSTYIDTDGDIYTVNGHGDILVQPGLNTRKNGVSQDERIRIYSEDVEAASADFDTSGPFALALNNTDELIKGSIYRDQITGAFYIRLNDNGDLLFTSADDPFGGWVQSLRRSVLGVFFPVMGEEIAPGGSELAELDGEEFGEVLEAILRGLERI